MDIFYRFILPSTPSPVSEGVVAIDPKLETHGLLVTRKPPNSQGLLDAHGDRGTRAARARHAGWCAELPGGAATAAQHGAVQRGARIPRSPAPHRTCSHATRDRADSESWGRRRLVSPHPGAEPEAEEPRSIRAGRLAEWCAPHPPNPCTTLLAAGSQAPNGCADTWLSLRTQAPQAGYTLPGCSSSGPTGSAGRKRSRRT